MIRETIIGTEDDLYGIREIISNGDGERDFFTLTILDLENEFLNLENRVSRIYYKMSIEEVIKRSHTQEVGFELGYRFPRSKHLIDERKLITSTDTRRLPYIGSEILGKGLVSSIILDNNKLNIYKGVKDFDNIYSVLSALDNVRSKMVETLNSYGVDIYGIIDKIYGSINKKLLLGRVLDLDITTTSVRVLVSNDLLLHYYIKSGLSSL